MVLGETKEVMGHCGLYFLSLLLERNHFFLTPFEIGNNTLAKTTDIFMLFWEVFSNFQSNPPSLCPSENKNCGRFVVV